MRRDFDFSAIVKVLKTAGPRLTLKQRRERVAEFCRMIDKMIRGEASPKSRLEIPGPLPHLAPRVRQTLAMMLQGESEKQIAHKLRISRHTVHVYIKQLYKILNVNSRGELMAKFVGRLHVLDDQKESATNTLHGRDDRRSGGSDASRATA